MDKLTDRTWSVWEGSVKSITTLCPKCRFHRKIASQDRCYWGIAYKVLSKPALSYCQLIERPSPRERMLKLNRITLTL